MKKIKQLRVKNFRCIKDTQIDLGDITVLFGPNGSGKTTWLDTIWFLRDCCIRGISEAAADRNHGIGMLWSRAQGDEGITITIETESLSYILKVEFAEGKIDPYPEERILLIKNKKILLERGKGSNEMRMCTDDEGTLGLFVPLQDPDKLALNQYLMQAGTYAPAQELNQLLRHIRMYDSRSTALFELRKYGSESDFRPVLWSRAQNLWSVLRGLNDKRYVDTRYNTIRRFMSEAFPDFDDLLIEQTGPQSVYGSFIEKGAPRPVMASGVSTGHLQMLIHLAALFSDIMGNEPLILMDEPENSLHPHALSVLATAIKEATGKWHRQVILATHSPVLLSQFDVESIVTVVKDKEGASILTPVCKMEGMQKLLEEYALGSLYMAEAIAPQSDFIMTEVNNASE